MRFSLMNTEHADEDGRNYDVNVGGRLGQWKQTEEEREGVRTISEGQVSEPCAWLSGVIPKPSRNSRKCHEEDDQLEGSRQEERTSNRSDKAKQDNMPLL